MAREQIPHKLQWATDGAFRGRQASLHGFLRFLVKIEGIVQVPSQEIVRGFVRSPNELGEQLKGESNLALASVLYDDLCEDQIGEVFAGAAVYYADVDTIADHLGNIVQLYVPARAGVIKAAVTVFANKDFRILHGISAAALLTKSLTRAYPGRTVELDTAVQYIEDGEEKSL